MHFKSLLPLLLLLSICTAVSAVTFPTDWAYQSQLQTNPAQVVANQTNFPVLVTEAVLPAEMLDNDGTQDALANGGDIRFTTDAAGTTPIPFEIVSFTTGGTPAVEIWVRMPTVDAAVASSFYVWWGATASEPATNDPGFGSDLVWNTYEAVWHLQETPTGAVGDFQDSTANNWDSINTGNQPVQVAGPIGNAAQFDGNEQITINNAGGNPNLDTPNSFTLQGWVSGTNMSGFRTWLSKSDSWNRFNQRWMFYNVSFGASDSGIGRNGSEAQWTGAANPNYNPTPAWYTITVDSTSNLARLIHNGTDYGTRAFTQGNDATAAFNIGMAPGENWSGVIDEVRISQFVRPTSWVQTEYNNMNNPAGFFAVPGPIIILNGRYWVSDGASGAFDNDWHNAANWSSTSGGAGGAGVPGTSHLAIFDTNSPAISVNASAAIDINALQISNFAGNIDASAQSISIQSSYSQSSGTVDISNATLNIAGNLGVSGGTFTSTDSTTNAGGSNAQSFDLNGASLHHLNLNGSGGVIFNSGAIIGGHCHVSAGPLSSNASLTFQGNLVCDNSVSLSAATMHFAGTSILSGSVEPDFSTLDVNSGALLTVNRSVNLSTASVNGTLINNGLLYFSVPSIDFNSVSVTSYGNQDNDGTFAVEDGGRTLFVNNNTWKKINFNYTITPTTVLSFDFRSGVQGEIHAIGFDDDNNITQNQQFQLYGTQNWGDQTYRNYPGGDVWVHYEIPVGTFYTGAQSFITFLNDHDGGAGNAEGRFRDLQITEGTPPTLSVTVSASGTLGGNGIIEGDVSVADGGTLSPGATGVDVDTLTVNRDSSTSLSLSPSSDLRFDLDAPGTGDLVQLTGTANDLVLDGVLNITDAGALNSGTYTLFTYTGTLTDNGLTIGTLPLGVYATVDTTTAGQVNLIVTVATIELVWDDNGGTENRPWNLGVMISGSTSAPSNWVVRNGPSGNVPIDVYISTSDSANWTNSAATGNNQFVINVDINNDLTFDADLTVQRLVSDELPPGSAHAFNLNFVAPTGSSTVNVQNITITILASVD